MNRLIKTDDNFINENWFSNLLDMILNHKTEDKGLISSMDTIAKYLLGETKISEIKKSNQLKVNHILGLFIQ